MDRIARRRTDWVRRVRSVRDVACARCETVYAEHDLVLSQRGRVCEACEGALEIARVGRLHATTTVRVALLGVGLLTAAHGAFALGHAATWAFAWTASLGGIWALGEGLRHLLRHRQLRATAVRAEADAPPWWGAAAPSVLTLTGLASLVIAALV